MSDDLTTVGWCGYVLNGQAIGFRHLPHDGDMALALKSDAADRIDTLTAELERTRQAWVNGDDPMCDDVCMIACKGPCGALTEEPT